MALTTQQAVQQLTSIATTNQPRYIYDQLKALGYNKNPYLPSGSELDAGMLALYMDDKEKFYSVLTNLPFDETVTNGSLNSLSNLLAQYNYTTNPNAKFSLKGAWEWAVKTVAGEDKTVVEPTTITKESISIGAVIGLIVIAILLVVIVWFAFFKKS